MADSKGSRRYSCRRLVASYACYALLSCVLCTGLWTLQRRCLNVKSREFVNEYCLGNTNMRTVVAAVLTAQGISMTWAVMEFSCALRTCLLSRKGGINEGAFVALGPGAGWNFKVAALRSKYALALLPILCIQYGSGAIEPLANLVLETVNVYVANESTAQVYNGVTYYNTTDVSFGAPSLTNSIKLLAGMVSFSSGANSVVDADNAVETVLVRSGFIQSTVTQGGDTSNALKHNETTATVATKCQFNSTSGVLGNLVGSSSIQVVFTSGKGSAAGFMYDISSETVGGNRIQFQSRMALVECAQNCSGRPVASIQFRTIALADCITAVDLQQSEIIYTLATRKIEIVRGLSSETTVQVKDLASLVRNQTLGPEQVAKDMQTENHTAFGEYVAGVFGTYYGFEQGLFQYSLFNILHSKICAGVANGLSGLWFYYGGGINVFAPRADLPLYSIVQQVHVDPTLALTALIALFSITLAVCISGALVTLLSPINVMPNNELSLVDSLDEPFLMERKKDNLSNDPGKLCSVAFQSGRQLYLQSEEAGNLVIGYMPGCARLSSPSLIYQNLVWDW